jgi:hypothetical protein
MFWPFPNKMIFCQMMHATLKMLPQKTFTLNDACDADRVLSWAWFRKVIWSRWTLLPIINKDQTINQLRPNLSKTEDLIPISQKMLTKLVFSTDNVHRQHSQFFWAWGPPRIQQSILIPHCYQTLNIHSLHQRPTWLTPANSLDNTEFEW